MTKRIETTRAVSWPAGNASLELLVEMSSGGSPEAATLLTLVVENVDAETVLRQWLADED